MAVRGNEILRMHAGGQATTRRRRHVRRRMRRLELLRLRGWWLRVTVTIAALTILAGRGACRGINGTLWRRAIGRRFD